MHKRIAHIHLHDIHACTSPTKNAYMHAFHTKNIKTNHLTTYYTHYITCIHALHALQTHIHISRYIACVHASQTSHRIAPHTCAQCMPSQYRKLRCVSPLHIALHTSIASQTHITSHRARQITSQHYTGTLRTYTENYVATMNACIHALYVDEYVRIREIHAHMRA